jgi:iron-sulfur cluster assembly protein
MELFKIKNNAAKKIEELIKNQKGTALKIGLKKGGCAGMEYTMTIIFEEPTGTVIRQDGAVVQIDPLAEMFLFGTEMDYKSSLLESGFVFNNPNVQSSCGCGESISFGS